MNSVRVKEIFLLVMVLSLVLGIKLVDIFNTQQSAIDDLNADDVSKIQVVTMVDNEADIVLQENDKVSSSINDQNMILIHIKGAVKSSGVYEMPEGSRVYDAIEKAGGYAENAQKDALNMAAYIYDAQQIIVPYIGEHITTHDLSIKSKWTIADLNAANEVELQSINGIGESTAKKIIEYRNLYGGYKTLDDLCNVDGIGKKNIEKWRKIFIE